MDVTVLAAWIAAGAAVVAAAIAYWSGHQQVVRQQAFERQQSRLVDRRATYRGFLSPAEGLVDLQTRYIRAADISRYELAVIMSSAVAELVPEAPPSGDPINPIPELDPDGLEVGALRELSASMRTQRVMVELVGPDEVAQSAMALERCLRRTTGAIIEREAAAARDCFVEALGLREDFLREAKKALAADA
ncbi:hypothetical protein BA895_03850 [Humibacillus sp. DSM 29435]|uniref:hypothetical protein n=1 Tax=Humibacillus sp. DSM 29435 TaxID=1869167 RepID=UPI0008730790|nr:hypothetical protein [Humibacillus sp. DSM 29435]OFE16717.1 hypothetical protein BA895_03850 [Humibacillus sp. DSM 29435]